MQIVIKDKAGNVVDTVPASTYGSVASTVCELKKKYPPGEYTGTLQTY